MNRCLSDVRQLPCMFLLSLLLFAGTAGASAPDDFSSKVLSSRGLPGLLATIAERGTAKVIIRVDGGTSDRAFKNSGVSRIAVAQEGVLAELAASGTSPTKVKKFTHIPYMAMTVTGPALATLLTSGRVTAVHEDKLARPKLDKSVPAIDASALQRAKVTGTGMAVAVLDSGVEKLHPFIKGSVVSEACYSTNDTSHKATSLCPKKVEESTEPGSAVPYGPCPREECGHGTNVAGIVAGRAGITGSPGPGVAPGASIIAVQVFSRIDARDDCDDGEAPCVNSYDSDQIRGLERVYALRNTYTIAAVNMSLGGGQAATNCDTEPHKAIIDLLRAAGIATVIASGNEEYCGYTSYPACISTAISVGATDPDNSVADYSNSASFMTLFAPGSEITTSYPRQEGGSGYEAENGTSMAAPHVAGAWALLKQAKPAATVDEVLAAFTSTGLSVSDSGKCPAVTKKLINVNEAYQALLGKSLITVGKTGNGSGTVVSSPEGINCGTVCTAPFTSGTAVTLTAQPGTDASFTGWSGGGCTGTGACTVTPGGKIQVGATFSGPCTYTVSPDHSSFAAKGGTIAVAVTGTGEDTCPAPNVSVSDPWLAATVRSFAKNRGVVSVLVHYNDNPDAREGTVTIGDQELAIEQSETVCTLPVVNPAKESFSSYEDSGVVSVEEKADCEWTARTVPPADQWITITGGSRGAGVGRILFDVAENTSGDRRTGKIEVSLTYSPKKKRTFTVKQDAAD